MKDLETRIAEAICELNCWETPSGIRSKVKRKLTEDEIRVVQSALESFVPYSRWIKTWQSQDGVKLRKAAQT